MEATAERSATAAGRGRHAARPTAIPAAGWKDIAVRAVREAKADGVPLLAAGVAFFGLLALAPALAALAAVYGLFADPAEAGSRVEDLLAATPAEFRDLVTNQLEELATSSERRAGVVALGGLVVALWSASSGMKHLIGAVNRAYDEEERRGFLRLRGMSLLLTVGAIVFLVVTVAAIAFVPAAVADTSLEGPARVVISVLRWPLLAVAMVLGLTVLYRYGPDRDEPEWRWTAPGSVAATIAWLAGSALFSLYAANFANYDKTYGSLGAVVVVMLWLFLTAYVVVLGAEINAEAERQTLRDTTEGHDRPLGQREAHAADTVGPTAEEVKAGAPPGADVAGPACRDAATGSSTEVD